MKIYLKTILSITLITLLLSVNTHIAGAAVSSWNNSAQITPNYSTEFSSQHFFASLDRLKDTGSTHVTLIIPYYQSNIHSTDLQPGSNTPSDSSLSDAIEYAHSIGLKVILKPHLEVFSGEWRAHINPSDRDSWYQKYSDMLVHYATIAQQKDVSGMIVGTELYRMSAQTQNFDNTARWQQMIQKVRDVYAGSLSYSANHRTPHEKDEIYFWPSLDYIGISAYFPLAEHTQTPSFDELIASWNQVNNNEVRPLHERWGIPLSFTEIGYKSVDGANQEPFAWWRTGNFNEELQALLYEALFSYWNSISFITGMHLWDWKTDPNAGGSGDIDYTAQNKLAEDVMRKWFTSQQDPQPTSTPQPSVSPTPIPDTDFVIDAQTSPQQPIAGQQTEIHSRVQTNNTLQNVIVDAEIYLENNKIFQFFWENQTLNALSVNDYFVNWIPANVGKYVFKIGIFENNWSSLIHWEDQVRDIEVVQAQQTPTATSVPTSVPSPTAVPTSTPAPTTVPVTPTESPSPTVTASPTPTASPSPIQTEQIDIWWPLDSGVVSGTQPFKAMLGGRDINSYTMYWQVDGNGLNQMDTSYEEYPHKQAWVDLSNWNWNPQNNYIVNFIAKDASGNIIASRSVLINVQH